MRRIRKKELKAILQCLRGYDGTGPGGRRQSVQAEGWQTSQKVQTEQQECKRRNIHGMETARCNYDCIGNRCFDGVSCQMGMETSCPGRGDRRFTVVETNDGRIAKKEKGVPETQEDTRSPLKGIPSDMQAILASRATNSSELCWQDGSRIGSTQGKL